MTASTELFYLDPSSSTMSSEDKVREDESDSTGVVVGGVLATLARASASETADRYETAVGMGGKPGVGFFLNMEGVGDLLNTMGDSEEAGEGITV